MLETGSLGILLKAGLTQLGGLAGGEATARLLAAIPVFPLAMVGGLIVQVLLQRSRQTRLVSPVAQASIGSLAMDLLITAAMASLNLPLLEENWLPFALLAAAGLTWNVCAFLWLAPRIFGDHWFERGIADFGQGTGVTATGLLLLRLAAAFGRGRDVCAYPSGPSCGLWACVFRNLFVYGRPAPSRGLVRSPHPSLFSTVPLRFAVGVLRNSCDRLWTDHPGMNTRSENLFSLT